MAFSPSVDIQNYAEVIEENQFNLAQVNGFRLIALEFPVVDLFCQAVQLPRAELAGNPVYQTPLNPYPLTGTAINYSDLSLTFLVDEKFANYRSIYNWMVGIGFPQDHEQFQQLVKVKNPLTVNTKAVESSLRSEIDLIMLDSMSQPIVKYKFHDAFPVTLESLPFDVTITEAKYFSVAASFRFSYYTIEGY